ncbi:hypothetical protein DRV85_08875 [Rhodosalinus halophilus]|uniref:Uncharacterized protein n=1 Tax=Rhodosalinus halophilus TaxID=2259333 RepID=A0A365U9V7_9RHOB|nr:hypothetical protein DRV85_08875 [Rhodosalinus halophilus]
MAGIAKGEIVHVDASLIRADVSRDSLILRHVDMVKSARDRSGRAGKICTVLARLQLKIGRVRAQGMIRQSPTA